MKRNLALLGVALGAILVGCTVGPNYVAPRPLIPRAFRETPATTQVSATQRARAATQPHELPTAAWWRNFRDPQLDSLIERATRGNLDLRLAEARLRQARAQYGVARADFVPTVNGSAQYTHTRSSQAGKSSGGTTTTTTTTGGTVVSSGGSSRSPESDLWQAGFDSTWEIDIWGKVRREVESAGNNIDAAVENRRNVLVTLLAEVATTYIQYRQFEREIQIANDNIAAQQVTLGITQKKYEAGLKDASELEVAQSQALVYTTQSQLPTLEQDMKQAAHKLGVLLGESPDAVMDELGTKRPIPEAIIPEVPIGLPSDLLRRRPDIRNSERLLAAATANIGVAVADLFPRFSLTGSFGLESPQFKELSNSQSRFWSIGPSVTVPLLDWGRIRSNIQVQNALQEQAFVTYQTTILNALQEVEDSVVAYSREQVRRQSLHDAVEQDRKAASLALLRFNAGITDFLTVLDAQRTLYAAEDQLVQSEALVSLNLVSLYKALGGGWEVIEQHQKNIGTFPPEQAKAERVSMKK
jgi:NodT family efflux transporter outer membrane factor (OMF) lipoprotein